MQSTPAPRLSPLTARPSPPSLPPRRLRNLLAQLREKGIEIKTSGDDRLVIDAPKGAITPELRSALSAHKVELLQILNSERQPPSPMAPGPIAPAPVKLKTYAPEVAAAPITLTKPAA